MLASAFRYLSRKKARTILLSCILVTLCAGCLLALMLYRGTRNAVRDIKEAFASGFAISILTKSLPEGTSTADFAPFDQALLDKVLNIGGVKDYSIENRSYACFEDVTFMGGLWSNAYRMALDDPDYLKGISGQRNELYGQSLTESESLKGMELYTHLSMLIGSTNTELNENFEDGTFVLKQGRHIVKNDRRCAMISKQVAEASGLNLGDFITAHYNSYLYQWGDPNEIWAGPIDLTVVGIFDVAGFQPIGKYTAEPDIAANWIFTDWESLNTYSVEYASAFDIHVDSTEYGEVIFKVEEPADLERIVSRVRAIPDVDPLRHDVFVLDAHYRDAIRPLNTIHALSLATVLLLLLTTIATLGLLFSLWGKSRRREIGIDLSIGYSKREILGQFLAECMILTVICFAISCFAANLAAGPLAQSLIQSAAVPEALAAEELTPEERLERYRAGDFSLEELRPATVDVNVEDIDVRLSFGAMAIVFALAAVIVALALLRGVWGILNTPPRKILSEFW
jgi:putative ABC transport system permease protein